MLDSLSVPRRPFDFEDYIDILRRNLLWILAPTFAGIVISTVVAFMMQDVYYSAARIRVTPQQISTELVQNVTSQDVADRINGMAQTILSRSTLTSLINTYGLYKKELKSEPMEDVVELMKKAIVIAPEGGTAVGSKFLPVMQVGFAYSDPHVAQRVCQDLVSRFMSLSTQDVVESQQQTNQFLNDEAEQAKHDLDQLEQKLNDYRAKNAGRLPEEMQTNMQEMNALEAQLGSLSEAGVRNNEQRMMLQTQLNAAKDRLALIHSPQAQAINAKVAALDQQIETTENNIAQMRERYTEDFPDLQAAKDQLAFLQRERAAAAKEKPPKVDTAADPPTIARERLDAQAIVDQLQTELKANAMDAKNIAQGTASVNAQLREYEGRLQGVPGGDKEYADLLSERDLAKARYMEASVKREKSDVSVDLERRKQGETLELLDSASLPITPSAPNRTKILPTGAAIGLLVGVVLVAVREVKDTSLKNLKDARLYTQLSILGSIPLLENDVVVQRRKQVMWVGWATATLAGLAIIAGSVAHYYLTRG